MPSSTTGRHRTRSPRTGRRPGSSGTRRAILESARRLFAERGYQAATMRAIASDAGVDASLVVHFFTNKPTLLREAIQWPFDPEVEVSRLLVDGPDAVGTHVAELFVRTWDQERGRNPILTLLRAASSEPQAAELLREFLREQILGPLMDQLGSDEPELRASLAASQLAGLGIVRYVLRIEPLASAKPADVVELIGPTMHRYLTGKLATARTADLQPWQSPGGDA